MRLLPPLRKVSRLCGTLLIIGEFNNSVSIGKTICSTTPATCGGSFETCGNESAIWYTYNGKKYTCASVSNCNAAATSLANDMTKNCKISKTEFNQKVQSILNTYPIKQ